MTDDGVSDNYNDVSGATKRQFKARQLPGLWRSGVELAWVAARKEVVGSSVVMSIGAAVAIARVVAYAAVAGQVVRLTPSATSGWDLAASLGLLGALVLTERVVNVYQANKRYLLAELVGVEADRRVIAAANAVDLVAFESPVFYDQMARAQAESAIRPTQLVIGLQNLSSGVISGAGVIVGILLVAPVLAPITIVVFLPVGLVLWHRTSLEVDFSRRMTRVDRERQYVLHLLTSRENVKEVRVFGTLDFLRTRYEKLSQHRLESLRRLRWSQAKLELMGTAMSALLAVAMVALAGVLYTSGRLPLASLAAALVAVQQLSSFVRIAGYGAASLHEAAAFLADYTKFVGFTEQFEQSASLKRQNEFKSLCAEGISFSYLGAKREALSGISFEIAAGEIVGLVGENGSGKSTLAKIVAGLYTPSSGRLLFDGGPVAPGSVAVMFQDFSKYAYTARENICFGDIRHWDDTPRVETAAREAGIHDTLTELPRAYETRLTREFDEGVDLSHGQWARLALARILFSRAELIILDEPTAFLDPIAERDFALHLRERTSGHTVILVSHRLAAVSAADKIILLSGGQIAETGTHRELMEMRALYYKLFLTQKSEKVVES